MGVLQEIGVAILAAILVHRWMHPGGGFLLVIKLGRT